MTSGDTVAITLEDARAAAKAWAKPENLAWFDALTDEDIAAQIASNPDAAPELTDEWLENARLVIPLKGRKRAGRDSSDQRAKVKIYVASETHGKYMFAKADVATK